MKEGRLDEAFKAFQKILIKFPNSIEAKAKVFEIANKFFEKKDYFRALNIFESGAKRWPDELNKKPEINFAMAEIYFSQKDFKVVSKTKPSLKTLKNLIFAFNVCRFVKSNAIVIAKNNTTIGIGSGQPSRLDSCKIAINKMKQFQNIQNNDQMIAASDAFFPFVDGIETLVQAGISAVIQPSGSIKDKEIIKFANQTGTILVFSKTRHFKH